MKKYVELKFRNSGKLLKITEKGKPVERRGRKANDLRWSYSTMMAGLPK
ncbi:hypothetical protein DCCM_4224 [Desulfocucumis palustris]|uniref:Uncharacterized protein n=1 Tax=Desulfocucumis palustris TaxID=1898651 RepID=A0A2L2XMC4_9FIRM|nr:hypothetical protein DCCM_4224 [Desulfocucumis palustris]